MWEPGSAYSTQYCPITWKITGHPISREWDSMCVWGGQGTAQRLAKCVKAGEAQREQGVCSPSRRPAWVATKRKAGGCSCSSLFITSWMGLELVVSDQAGSHGSCTVHVSASYTWLERTFCIYVCLCEMDAAGGAFASSAQNQRLQQHCIL